MVSLNSGGYSGQGGPVGIRGGQSVGGSEGGQGKLLLGNIGGKYTSHNHKV